MDDLVVSALRDFSEATINPGATTGAKVAAASSSSSSQPNGGAGDGEEAVSEWVSE